MKSSVTRGAHRADQIRHEHEAALEHADQMDLLACRIVALDLGGQLANPRLDAIAES